MTETLLKRGARPDHLETTACVAGITPTTLGLILKYPKISRHYYEILEALLRYVKSKNHPMRLDTADKRPSSAKLRAAFQDILGSDDRAKSILHLLPSPKKRKISAEPKVTTAVATALNVEQTKSKPR